MWIIGENKDIKCNIRKKKNIYILDLPRQPWLEALNLHMSEPFGQHLVQWPLQG